MTFNNWADYVLFLWGTWFVLKFLFLAFLRDESVDRAAYFLCSLFFVFLLFAGYCAGTWS